MALRSGFELAKRPEPGTSLAAPQDLDVRVSNYQGCVDLPDLVPGKCYSFRVTALGRIGEGPMHIGPASDVVSGRAA